MKNWRNLFRKIFTLILALVVMVGGASIYHAGRLSTVRAVGDLEVDWGVPDGDPIFVVINAAPGDMEDHNVVVTNNGSSTRPVGVRGVKTSGVGGLESVLEIVISEGGTDLYGGTTGTKTVSQFFTDSAGLDGIFLSNLQSLNVTTYNFKVTFPESAGNEFQDTQIVFDIIIGVSVTVPEECLEIEFSGSPIFGTSGNDRINGTLGNDLIFGFEGNDRIFGHGGDDCIVGGEGDDNLRGETGNDFIFGNEGNDLLVGAVSNDFLDGGSGNDNIRGENNNDIIIAGSGDDKVTGGNGDDNIDGGDGDDNISAENGRDAITGGSGNDFLDGGAGNDNIDGQVGNDNINGKAGNDNLIGCDGFDTINGHSGTDTCDGEVETNCEI